MIFDGGESVEHARGGGNNPTVGCEVVAGRLRNCVEFLRVMGASSFVQKVTVDVIHCHSRNYPCQEFYEIITQRIYKHNPPTIRNQPKMAKVRSQNFRYADTFVAILLNKVCNTGVYGGNQ